MTKNKYEEEYAPIDYVLRRLSYNDFARGRIVKEKTSKDVVLTIEDIETIIKNRNINNDT